MSDSPVRLTATVKAGGCASKLSPALLDQVLSRLPKQTDPNVLVGFDHADDAGVYKISPTAALVQTVDFFTPMVDDPYTFGQIAATNALSDVYAMGGRPITALGHVCFPANGDIAILERTLAGGLSKMMEAGCAVIGGHSVRDEEMKFGYSVTGLIDPERVFANAGAKTGDRLLFTKALGTGVITTAIKKDVAKQEWIDAAIRSMTTLNKSAAEVIAKQAVDDLLHDRHYGLRHDCSRKGNCICFECFHAFSRWQRSFVGWSTRLHPGRSYSWRISLKS